MHWGWKCGPQHGSAGQMVCVHRYEPAVPGRVRTSEKRSCGSKAGMREGIHCISAGGVGRQAGGPSLRECAGECAGCPARPGLAGPFHS